MPSVFPGMDPFIGGQACGDFHAFLLCGLRMALAPLLRPKYVARVEEYIYLQRPPENERPRNQPASFTAMSRRTETAREGVGLLEPPALLPLPHEDTEPQSYLEIRRRDNSAVVCVIELLSPINKERGTGQDEYLMKRASVHRSPAHLVEIDLLRGGSRLPMGEPLPPAEYYVFVARTEQWPECGVWPVGLRDHLPVIPIPLADGDPDVLLDLQAVFDGVYDDADYAFSLDYSLAPVPPLSPEDAAWVRETVERGDCAGE